MDDFKLRFDAAKAERKVEAEGRGREVYKFCFNGREREWDRNGKRSADPEEIFTSLPATIAEEFYGELFHTMTPENTPWVSYQAGAAIDQEQEASVTEDLEIFEQEIDIAIRTSNYYDEGPIAFQDAVFGTIAMWADKPRLSGGIVCEAVPVPQLYLRLGTEGIADRFREQDYYVRDLKTLFPDADWPRKLRDAMKNPKSSRAKVCWGFWPTYDDPENPVWVQQIRVDGEPIGMDEDLGEQGAVPLIVGRFNPVSGSPWGRGPGWKQLETMRVADVIARMTLEAMDRNLDPAYVYAHDGMLDLSDGIEAGIGYPAMPGTADSVRAIGTVDTVDQGFYTEERLDLILRDGFYREIEQRGKTPPSASQYIGQEQKQLRRVARPAGKLWREFGVGFLQRVEWLERQPGGRLQDVNFPMIEGGIVAPRPISPLERAQAREDVLVSQSILDMAMQNLGPEQAAMVVDGPVTLSNIKEKLKDKLVKIRTQEEILQIMQQAAPMMQQQGGGTDVPQG